MAGLLIAVLVGGYYYHIEDLQLQLAQAEEKEVTLKKDFEKKAFEAANLEAYRQQMVEMEESFGALVSQLPSDTEVPGLLEDITNKGLLNGLAITSINLQKEQAKEFYVELPIAIVASGSYHDLGAFISGMAGLPRIVTLHDFQLAANKKNPNNLDMKILAKTYRYKDEGVVAMSSSLVLYYVACLLGSILAGCSGDDFSDLDSFMAEKRSRPGGIIAPIPTFKAYEAFAYSATTLRSPFERPIEVRELAQLQATAAIKPDENRPKEFLEQFTLDSLLMVGTLERDDNNWTLIKDPEGGVHRVKPGNYLGRSHGKIVDMTDTYVSVVEIVSDGTPDGWVERPRTIKLSGI